MALPQALSGVRSVDMEIIQIKGLLNLKLPLEELGVMLDWDALERTLSQPEYTRLKRLEFQTKEVRLQDSGKIMEYMGGKLPALHARGILAMGLKLESGQLFTGWAGHRKLSRYTA